MIFSDPQALLAQIDADDPEWRLVVIDGWLGAGKTDLAKKLSRFDQIQALDLDPFLIGNDKIMEGLDWARLAAAVRATNARIVFSGVCALDVLARLELKADKHVYVKCMSGPDWKHEAEVEGDYFDHDEEVAQVFGVPVSPQPLEVRQYHDRFAPHRNADYEYRWLDANSLPPIRFTPDG